MEGLNHLCQFIETGGVSTPVKQIWAHATASDWVNQHPLVSSSDVYICSNAVCLDAVIWVYAHGIDFVLTHIFVICLCVDRLVMICHVTSDKNVRQWIPIWGCFLFLYSFLLVLMTEILFIILVFVLLITCVFYNIPPYKWRCKHWLQSSPCSLPYKSILLHVCKKYNKKNILIIMLTSKPKIESEQ